jgi:hypothetical protein
MLVAFMTIAHEKCAFGDKMSEAEYQGRYKEIIDRGRYVIDNTHDKDTLERAAKGFKDLQEYAERKSKPGKCVTPEEMSGSLLKLFLSGC